MSYSKRERLFTVLNGETADRPPITAYRHFPKQERDPKELSEIMVNWQKKYDWDIVKIHPSAVYMQEVFGDKFDYKNYYQDIFPIKTKKITSYEELSIFTEKNIDNPVLSDHIKTVELIRKKLGEDTPILNTLFTPLQTICGVFDYPFVRRHFPATRNENNIFELIKYKEKDLLNALENISNTYINYWKGMKEAGADGLFYAGVSWAREGYMHLEEWKKYIEYFDKKILSEVKKDGGIVMYHTCGIESNPNRFSDYPIDILHWDQGAKGNPSIKDSINFLKGITPMGGVDEMLFGTNSSKKISESSKQTIIDNKNIPFILAPYCSVSINSTDEELKAFRDSVNYILK